METTLARFLAVVAVAILLLWGCGKKEGIEVECDALTPGDPGCVGLPTEDASTATSAVYPLGCQVVVWEDDGAERYYCHFAPKDGGGVYYVWANPQ